MIMGMIIESDALFLKKATRYALVAGVDRTSFMIFNSVIYKYILYIETTIHTYMGTIIG